MSRLEAEPDVSAVTFSSFVPGFAGGRRIQFEDPSSALGSERQPGQDPQSQAVSTLDVAIGMFDTYEAELLAGRTFNASDLGAARAVVVNRSFVERFLQPEHDRGRQSLSALGLRFRYAPVPGQQPGTDAPRGWYQIVGVVWDFPDFPPALSVDDRPTVYHPSAPGAVNPVVLSVRFSGSIPEGFLDRFRQIAAEVDPGLQLRRVVPLMTFTMTCVHFGVTWRGASGC